MRLLLGKVGSVDDYLRTKEARARNNDLHVDLTKCDELEAAIDDDCSFDPGPVEQFTQGSCPLAYTLPEAGVAV